MIRPTVAIIALAATTACSAPALQLPPPNITPTPQTTTQARTTATGGIAAAKRALPKITVKGKAAKTGYDRDLYGDWTHTGGCDTRNRILARDLTDDKLAADHCTMLAGTLHDPYTGHTITYIRAGSYQHAVDLDHRVPLALSWQQGAWRWTPAKRHQFANDPANLTAVSPSANRQKGDSGPSAWLPRKANRCEYVARFVLVVSKYRLSINSADRDAAARILEGCK